MVFIGSVFFVIFGGQTYKNVQVVWKVFLVTSLCVLVVSLSITSSFWMKFMWMVLNSYTIILGLETCGWKSPRTNQGSLRRKASRVPKLSKSSPFYGCNRRLVGQPSLRRLRGIHRNLGVKYTKTKRILNPKPQTNETVFRLKDEPLVAICLWDLPLCTVHYNTRGEILN